MENTEKKAQTFETRFNQALENQAINLLEEETGVFRDIGTVTGDLLGCNTVAYIKASNAKDLYKLKF